VTALLIAAWWVSLVAAFLLGFYLGRRRFRDGDPGAGPHALEDQLKRERAQRTDRG